jgi:uncharacterized protein (DUF2384 family)
VTFAATHADTRVATKNEPVSMDATAVKAMVRLFAAWKISVPDSAMLAGVSPRTWNRMKAGTWSASLSQDQMMRASGLVGVYKGLHLYFSDELADQWVQMPNQGNLFNGSTPAAFMVSGGLPAILRVREYIDALRGGM